MWTPERLKRLRARYGESQRQFAGRAGVAVDTVRGWEQGRFPIQGPAALILSRLAEDIDSGQPRPHPDAVAV